MTYYSREILEQYLKDTRLNKVLDIIDETEPYITEGKTAPVNINVRFCHDCPLFDINGIQPDPGIIHLPDSGLCNSGRDSAGHTGVQVSGYRCPD